jgi:hypothetical protein
MSGIWQDSDKQRRQASALHDKVTTVSLPAAIKLEEHYGLKRPSYFAYVHL